MVCVSWSDANAYIAWLNGRLGEDIYRLPTEAEWEYASRAGSVAAKYWGNDATSKEQCQYENAADARYSFSYPSSDGAQATKVADCDDRFSETSNVGRFGVNAFGLSDMLGNVSEWTEDCGGHNTYNGRPLDQSAWLEANQGICGFRVIRGGAWNYKPQIVRSAFRLWIPKSFRGSFVGIRLARDLE